MTQEDKELLFKDLCARLPYGVVCEFKRSTLNVLYNKIYDNTLTINNIEYVLKDDSIVRPYLRPMSSMTKEEKREYNSFIKGQQPFDSDFSAYPIEHKFVYEFDTKNYIDWMNKHHFDYRGLIEKGLALEAPEDMYNTK